MGVPKWRPPPVEQPSSPPRKRPRLRSFASSISRRPGSRNLRLLHNMRIGSQQSQLLRQYSDTAPVPVQDVTHASSVGPSTTPTGPSSSGSTELLQENSEMMGSVRDNEYERDLEARYSPPLYRHSPSPPSRRRRHSNQESEQAGASESDMAPSDISRYSFQPFSVSNPFRPYHTTLRRHNAIRNLRSMLQPTRNSNAPPYHNQAWTSSLNLPQIADSLPDIGTDCDDVSESVSRTERIREISAHVQALNRMVDGERSDGQETSSTLSASASLSAGAQRASTTGSLITQAHQERVEAASPRMAWLLQRSRSSGQLPKLEEPQDQLINSTSNENEQEEEEIEEEEEAEEEGEGNEEDSVRPLTRSTSFSSSTSRRSQRTVHFTNPLSDTLGASANSEEALLSDDDEGSRFTSRVGTPPPPALLRTMPTFMVLPDFETALAQADLDGIEIENGEEVAEVEDFDAEEDFDATEDLDLEF